MKNSEECVIRCPSCGAEYLPAEIYYPNSFFGRPSCIDRDLFTRKVDSYCGTSVNFNERYTCDYCKKPMLVTAKVVFNTRVDEKNDVSSVYSTKLTSPRLTLREDS